MKNHPPNNIDMWERGLDPWHEDAFPSEFKSHAPHRGKRAEGWYRLDAYGNAIGFVPDTNGETKE